jgi:hypothetical protein
MTPAHERACEEAYTDNGRVPVPMPGDIGYAEWRWFRHGYMAATGRLVGVLRDIRELMESLPNDIDLTAREDDTSPRDMTAHVCGLIAQRIDGEIGT